MTIGQGFELGPFTFTVIRILIAFGFVRIVYRGERIVGKLNGLDWLMLTWAMWALASSAFHANASGALVFRLGLVYNTCGIYFLIRVFCQSIDDVFRLYIIIGLVLIPLSLEMLSENITVYNLFSMLGGVSPHANIRHGAVRAKGPFAHPILAGTVGAVCLPLMIGLWRKKRMVAFFGIFACLIIIVTCSSSGPMLSGLAGIWAVFMWRFRHRIRLVKWAAILGYIGLDVVMRAPAYYILARVPAVSGSTGYHRARLIQSAIEYLNEWWLAGTDYTRHWMVHGVSWSPDHADITNHYLKLGVIGGLPLMILFIIIMVKGFGYIGQILRNSNDLSTEDRFTLWTLGASLLAHAATMISVAYFDQSFLFLYLNLGAIGSAWTKLYISKL